MFILVLITCVTLQGQTNCHEFEREVAFVNHDACLMAAAMEKGRYNSRMQRRNWARYNWECRNRLSEKPI